MDHPKVFISYSHDSPEHADFVLQFSDRLRQDGIDSIIDQYAPFPAEGWPMWMEKQIKEADFVLLICTAIYNSGSGVRWEVNMIYNQLYSSNNKNTKFIPLLFEEGKLEYIPAPLRGFNYYQIDTKAGYEALYRHLTNQPIAIKPELEAIKAFPPHTRQTDLYRPLRVFLCHSSKDKPKIRDLYNSLKLEGIEPWLDEKQILPGQDWQFEITKAVRNSDIVIVCLSQEAINKKGYLHKEIRYALDVADEQPEGIIFIIPLKLEECDVPERLRRWQWVNMFEEDGYTRLICALKLRSSKLSLMNSVKTSYNKRLPIYLILDCSRSMKGEPITVLEQGIKSLIADLKGDPQALETVVISLITFARDAFQISPLIDLMSFSFKELSTYEQDEIALGAALKVLNDAIDQEVVCRMINNPGDYCPLVLVCLDGMPTDDWVSSAKLLINRRNRRLGILYFLGMGSEVSIAQLITKVPGITGCSLNEMQPDSLMEFVKWIDQDDY